MIAAAINPRSVAVETCCGAGSPVALTKRVLFIPIRAASRFIRSTNACSGAGGDFRQRDGRVVARLHDLTVQQLVHRHRFLGSMNILDPSARHAFCDTVAICDGVSSLSLSARKTRYAVINLVSEAGSARLVGIDRDERLAAQNVDQEIGLGGDRWRRYRRRHRRSGPTRQSKKGQARTTATRDGGQEHCSRFAEEAHYTVTREALSRVAEPAPGSWKGDMAHSGSAASIIDLASSAATSAHGAVSKRASPRAAPIVLRRTVTTHRP